jgi:uroporphyrinogen-III synthase
VRLLVTRPEPDGERTAAVLRARGHDVVLAALLQVEAIADAQLGSGPWSALIVTSANALRAIEAHPRRPELLALRLFVVGRRTEAAARAAGYQDVIAGGGNVQDLARCIGQSARTGGDPLLYLAGEDRSGDLAGDLAAQGVIAHMVEVYRARKARAFPRPAAAALAAGAIEGVLHFSRRTAEAYLDCVRAAGILEQGLKVPHYCLSSQVAGPLLAAGARNVQIAPRPEESALLALMELKA